MASDRKVANRLPSFSHSSSAVNVVGGGADGDGSHSGSDGKRPGDQSGSNWRQPNKHDDRYGPGSGGAGGSGAGGAGAGVGGPGGSGSHGGGGSGSNRLPPGEGVDYGRPYDRYPDFAANEYGGIISSR